MICEEFLGFVELKAMNAETIANAIDNFIDKICTLDPKKCVGQGYDGCSTMSGHIHGVQAILRKKYPNALFFHCASHRLNLVINDLNSVPDVRNTISTVKNIINFFRDSVLRRKYVPNIPSFCETRWSQKHRSIAIFKEHFETIVAALDTLSRDGNRETRSTAFQLHAAATKSTFIICVFLIAKYSALLEPVVNALQSKSLDLFQCKTHIDRIVSVIAEDRRNVDTVTNLILNDSETIAEILDIELNLPRIVENQKHRSNQPSKNFSDYFKKSLIIPYLDSITVSLKDRFSHDHSPAFALHSLHPHNMLKDSVDVFKSMCSTFSNFYNINVENETDLWYSVWQNKKLNGDELKNLEMVELFEEADSFFPQIRNALHISLAQPCGTTTIERSFSTLRRVKTWVRSTMEEDRLSGNTFYK